MRMGSVLAGQKAALWKARNLKLQFQLWGGSNDCGPKTSGSQLGVELQFVGGAYQKCQKVDEAATDKTAF